MTRAWILVALALVALSGAQNCFPNQHPCGNTCCTSAEACCASGGCAPPNATCCSAAPGGHCALGEVCCQNGCSPKGSTCCATGSCAPGLKCCFASSEPGGGKCFDPRSDMACCDGVGAYNTTNETCCNHPSPASFPSICPAEAGSCCYQLYKSPCFNPANSTCCPSTAHNLNSFVVPYVDAKCCGDQSRDYACPNDSLVCCPAFNGNRKMSVTERPMQPSGSPLPAPLERNTEGTCANATTQFCCPFGEASRFGALFPNSVPCRLGDLCCPGGNDVNGIPQSGGCCFGQPASQWSCGINGAPVCPCGYVGYPECVQPSKH